MSTAWTIAAAVTVYAAVMTFLFFVAMSGVHHERKRVRAIAKVAAAERGRAEQLLLIHDPERRLLLMEQRAARARSSAIQP